MESEAEQKGFVYKEIWDCKPRDACCLHHAVLRGKEGKAVRGWHEAFWLKVQARAHALFSRCLLLLVMQL